MSVDHSSANESPRNPPGPVRSPIGEVCSRIDWVFRAGWIDRARVDRAFDRQREERPAGIIAHSTIAAICIALFVAPTTFGEFAAGTLAVFYLLRLPRTFRIAVACLLQPMTLLIFLWVFWLWLSLQWTPNVSQGLDELASNRWALSIFFLWPVIANRRWFIAALAVGFLLANLAQGFQFVFNDADWMPWHREPNRYPGWYDAAVGGSLLTAALGLHLPAAIMGRGRTRLIAIAAAVVTLAGIALTGTRGAWIASTALLGCTVLVALVMSPRRRTVFATLGVLAVAAVAVGLLFRTPIVNRVNEARTEITAAFEDGNYTSPTGARIAMAGHAIEAFAAHPIRGVGAGGYKTWVDQHLVDSGIDPADRFVADHAHNALLQVAATTGLVGLALAACFLALAFRNTFCRLDRTTIGTYAAAPGFALLGLLLVSAFDVVHMNAQTAAVIGVLLAVTPTFVPKGERAQDESAYPSCSGATPVD